ncbi:hypothetical protein ACWD6I_21165 [Streptomyces sp. NPDC002454]
MTAGSHLVRDAHGRTLDLAADRAQAPQPALPTARGGWGRGARVALGVAAVLAAGLLLSVLLLVVRDLVTSSLTSGLAGLLVRTVLGPRRRERPG